MLVPSQGLLENSCVNALERVSYLNAEAEKVLTPSYAVFNKIKEIVSNTPLWENILLRVNSEVIRSLEPLDKLITSCAVNSYLLDMFFVGETQARRVLEFLSVSLSGKFTFSFPKKDITVCQYHLLSGNILLNLNSKFQDSSYKFSNETIVSSREDFKEYDKCLNVFKNHILELYKTGNVNQSIYEFNNNVIDSLESEINGNRNKVSKECSFIYHVNITEPPTTVSFKGSIESILNAPIGAYHAFDLEHYYNQDDNSDCIRLHQSWKDELTLAQHYENHKTDGIINSNEFCKNLKGMLSYDTPPKFTKLKQCQSACFNVDGGITPAGVFRTDINLFTGASVRYVTSIINPQDCLKHIEDILVKYGS
ncbi:MAG TPA: hypothetical protein VGP47_04310 [Parachlamydiaceae bacterium]|nr:hypothetical protein [Parachlamydiaceae bacterium]